MQRLLFWGMLTLVARQPAGAQTSPAATLQIIPTTYFDRTTSAAAIAFSHTNHFHVLLTNTSTAPLVLFEEWNSYGYYGLSFEITYPDGRTVRSMKKGRTWEKNYPSTVTIEPGGYYVFDVTFRPEEWANSLWLDKPTGHGTPCRLRAIYEIETSKESREEHAWTGTLTSAERAYTFW